MYMIILAFHSLMRWLVLVSLLYALYRSYKGWFTGKAFSWQDNTVRQITASVAHLQLIIGLWLYLISPIVAWFLHHFTEAVHNRPVRFFGMEHSTMMFTAIVLITIGSASAKRKKTDKAKFKTMTIWFTIALLVILVSVPWPFSPFASRPYLRGL